MWDGKSSPLAIIKAKINVILESLPNRVLEIGQDANQDGDDFALRAAPRFSSLDLSKHYINTTNARLHSNEL